MALLAPQTDTAASTEVLEQALRLQETTTHLLKHIKAMLLKYSYLSKQSLEEEARDRATNDVTATLPGPS